jgi:preprotein translocase subunit SecY
VVCGKYTNAWNTAVRISSHEFHDIVQPWSPRLLIEIDHRHAAAPKGMDKITGEQHIYNLICNRLADLKSRFLHQNDILTFNDFLAFYMFLVIFAFVVFLAPPNLLIPLHETRKPVPAMYVVHSLDPVEVRHRPLYHGGVLKTYKYL